MRPTGNDCYAMQVLMSSGDEAAKSKDRSKIPKKKPKTPSAKKGRPVSDRPRRPTRDQERKGSPRDRPTSRRGRGGRRDDRTQPPRRGSEKRERALSISPPRARAPTASREPKGDTEELKDAKTWGLTRDREAYLDLRKIQTWTNLYVPAGPLGFNTMAPYAVCPFDNCLAKVEDDAHPLRIKGKIGIKLKDRTKIRIYAAFNNIRGCKEHYAAIFKAVDKFADQASSDVVRIGLSKPAFTYTKEEAANLRSPLISALSMWRKMEFSATAWTQPSLFHLRQRLTESQRRRSQYRMWSRSP